MLYANRKIAICIFFFLIDMAGPKRGRGDKASAQVPEKVEGEPEIKVAKSEEDVKEETPKEEQISSETDQGKLF